MTIHPKHVEPQRPAETSPQRAKESFLAAMSHELRTPLNAIIGFAEIMDNGLFGPVAPDPYKAYVHDILLSARSVLQIIEDVLEISRAEAGDLVLRKREVALRAIVEAAAAQIDRRTSAEHRHQLHVEVDADLVARVDPDKVQRILACLLSNAVKFSPGGSDVDVSAKLGADGLIRISVKDAGIGFARDTIEQAFVPFVQLDDSLSRRFDGAGVGLPLARMLAELHGGTVEIDSEPGAGTTATLVLPCYGKPRPVPSRPRRKFRRPG